MVNNVPTDFGLIGVVKVAGQNNAYNGHSTRIVPRYAQTPWASVYVFVPVLAILIKIIPER